MGRAVETLPWAGSPPNWSFLPTDSGARVVVGGDWTIGTVGPIEGDLAALHHTLAQASAISAPAIVFDLSGLGRLDTAGALLLHRAMADVPQDRRAIVGEGETRRALLEAVAVADRPVSPPQSSSGPVLAFLAGVGRSVTEAVDEALAILALLGASAKVIGAAIVLPSRVRFIPFVHQLQRTALDATPIIVLMSFLIGAIIAQQGAFYFRRFGADLYIVDMVGVLTLREIAVLLTAIMVAGRSGSAFTAELGSMKMREEIDALKVIGLDPVEMLVVPRLAALMLALPILTFLADLAALFGAAIVCNLYADIPAETFLHRLHGAIELRTFLVGIAKAPFMAMIIGLVASIEGLRVAGSAESLGQRTTLSVVKAIFMVIVVDGIFAMFYGAVGV